MTRSVDELFDAFDKRKQAERRASKDKAEKAAREREKAVAIIEKKVLAAIAPVIERIRERGHHAAVSSHLDEEAPYAVLEFRPKHVNENDPEPQSSRTRFALTGQGLLETTQEIAGQASRRVGERWKVSDVTEEWARQQLYALVESALKNY
jgi:hypothetical protein